MSKMKKLICVMLALVTAMALCPALWVNAG